MKGIWYEVWGRETGEPAKVLLMKFPDADGMGRRAAVEAVAMFERAGATELEILKVDEE